MTKEPVKDIELAGLSPTFPVIKDATVEMPVSASTTKPAAKSSLTGVGDIALADICENVWTTAEELKMSGTVKHLH